MDDRISVDRTEDDYFESLRDLIIYCICMELQSRDPRELTTFHGVEMIKRCAKGFFERQEVDQYQFSGEHEYYRHVLERIYRPLVDLGLLVENETNIFSVPSNSRLYNICKSELSRKSDIKWRDFVSRIIDEDE